MNKQIKGKISIKSELGKITVIASDETLDRHGDVLPIEQWDLAKFMLSPRMLVDHHHQVEKIVGKWSNVRIEGNKLLMDADFHEITPLSKAVKEMVENGYLDTVSVGFIYHGPEKDGGKPSMELIETSWVTVPANPNARIEASLKSLVDSSITDDEKNKVKDFIGEKDTDTPVEEEKPAEEPLEGEPEFADMSPEAMEADGWKIIKSKEDYFEWQKDHEGGVQLSLCDSAFLEKLLADSEKLQALTDKKVEDKKRVDVMKLALKEVARNVNHSLRELNNRE